MPRTVEITVTSDKVDGMIPKLRGLKGFLGMKVQKNISVDPGGDVISFEITNDSTNELMLLLEAEGWLDDDKISVTTSKPLSILSKKARGKVENENNESTWEEVLGSMNDDANMTYNVMMLMFISGFIAVLGINSNALHLVIGAMVIAPGFVPITRLVLGLVSENRDWRHGLKDTLKGYISVILGAVVAAAVIKGRGQELFPGTSSYLTRGVLVDYWTTITVTSILVSVVAAIAGGIVIMTNRSVLTAGVMIALALVPAASIIGMGLVEGNMDVAGKAGMRLGIEIGIVALFSACVFFWKKYTTHRRKMRS